MYKVKPDCGGNVLWRGKSGTLLSELSQEELKELYEQGHQDIIKAKGKAPSKEPSRDEGDELGNTKDT